MGFTQLKKITFYSIISMLAVVALSGCKTVIIPNYTNVERLSKLNPGMKKNEVLGTLDKVYPYDILNGEQDGCEVQHYKYKHPKQYVLTKQLDNKAGLRGGGVKYIKESDAYLVYKEGVLYSIHTIENGDLAPLLASIAEVNNACKNEGVKGCTDPESVNYNPDALEDNNTCEYCECGYVKNPNYNANRPKTECNSPCIKAKTNDDKEQQTCNTCDMLDAIKNSKANITLNINAPEQKTGTTTPATKTNPASEPGKAKPVIFKKQKNTTTPATKFPKIKNEETSLLQKKGAVYVGTGTGLFVAGAVVLGYRGYYSQNYTGYYAMLAAGSASMLTGIILNAVGIKQFVKAKKISRSGVASNASWQISPAVNAYSSNYGLAFNLTF